MARSWRWWAAGVLAAGAAGAGVAWLGAPDTIKLPADLGSQQQQQPRSAPSPTRPAPMPAPPSVASVASTPDMPPGIASDRWQALQQELAARPDELQRIAEHLRYAELLRRFRDQRSAPLAQQLASGIDERLQRHEIGAAEARQLQVAVLDVLLPDAPSRQAALARWEARHAATSVSDPHDADFLRRQAAVVAAWQQQPAAARDPDALQRDLDALRRTQGDSTTTTTGGAR